MFRDKLYHLFLFLLLGNFGFVQAQPGSIDSLENLLEVEESPTELIKIHNELCWQYQIEDLELSLKHGSQAFDLALKEKLYEEAVIAQRYMGISSGNFNKPDLAQEHFSQAIKTANKHQITSRQVALSYNDLGSLFLRSGEYEDAVEQFNGGILIADKVGDLDVSSLLNFNLAYAFFDIKEYDKCMAISRKGIQLILPKVTVQLGMLYQNLGNCYLGKHTYDSSKYYFEKAQAIFIETGNIAFYGHVSNSLGTLYFDLKEYEKSLQYYRRSMDIDDSLGIDQHDDVSYSNLASIYRVMGNYDSSIIYLEKAVGFAREYGHLHNLMGNLKYLSHTQYDHGDYKAAFEHHAEYVAIKDSILSEDNRINILKLQQKFENEKAINDNKLLKTQIEQIQSSLKWSYTWLYSIIIISILVLILIFLFYKNKRIRDAQVRAELEKSVLDLKSTALMAQLNPHLVFNILNSIQGLVASNEREKANIYISKFSMFMRKCIEFSDVPSIPLHEELLLLEEYFELERLRFEDKISLTVEDASDAATPVPPLILQPLVENCIKHGLDKNHKNAGKITISIKKMNSVTEIKVMDNGKGFPESFKIVEGHGVGISLSRIRTLNPKNSIELSQHKSPSTIKITIWE